MRGLFVVPAVGVAEVVAIRGGGADCGAVGGVDRALACQVVRVTLDNRAVGQVVQGHYAPLPIPSHSEFLLVAVMDQHKC